MGNNELILDKFNDLKRKVKFLEALITEMELSLRRCDYCGEYDGNHKVDCVGTNRLLKELMIEIELSSSKKCECCGGYGGIHRADCLYMDKIW